MELSFPEQSAAFLYAIVLGVLIGILYGVLKLARAALDFSAPVTFVTDVLFMLLSAVMTFMFSLAYLQGAVRLYLLPAICLGFALYRLTLGKLTVHIYTPVIGAVKKVCGTLSKKFKGIIKNLLKKGYGLLYNTRADKKKYKR